MCHLVLEDGSNLLKSFESNILKTLEVVDEMLEHRPSNHKVQFILTSTRWSSDLEKLYKTMYISPLICISNYLEAALYGGIKFGIKVLQPKNKKEYLTGLFFLFWLKIQARKSNFRCFTREIASSQDCSILQPRGGKWNMWIFDSAQNCNYWFVWQSD